MTRIRKGLSRTLSLILSVAVTLSVICVAVIPASAAVYDAAAAISYAKAHWNDGKGECAEFVRDCLKAGGLTSLTKNQLPRSQGPNHKRRLGHLAKAVPHQRQILIFRKP